MEIINLTYDEFMSMYSIKPGIVHIHKGLVYKNSPNSKEIVTEISKTKTHPVMKHVIIPEYYLHINDTYIGYVYRFNDTLHIVEDALALGIIQDINIYILELIRIVEELNKLNMCYWDFHQNNIYADKNGLPYLIDIDDMAYNPTRVNIYHQIKYLTEYILNLLLSQEKNLSQYLRNPVMQQYMSQESMTYIEQLNKKAGLITTLPYKLIEELENPIKRELIKSKIK